MSGLNISTVGIMGAEDPEVNEKIELVAYMLPTATVARLRAYASSCGESQHRVVAAAIEQYMSARKKQ